MCSFESANVYLGKTRTDNDARLMSGISASRGRFALNLHRSWTNGELVGFDLETTGVDPLFARPVSFAFATIVGGEPVSHRTALIQPGVPIPQEAQAVHGISDAMVKKDGLALDDALNDILAVLLDASGRAVPLVGMNLSYDLSLIDTLLQSRDSSGLRARGWCGPVLDIAVIDRHLDKWRKGKRKLGDLCHQYNVALDQAHDALADTAAAVLVLLALAERFPEIREHTPDALTALQVQWRREWCVDYNAYLKQNGRPPIDETAGNWPLMSDAIA